MEVGDLSAERRQKLIDELAEKISRWGLTTPAMLFLEAHRPLSFIASQALIFSQPLLGPLLGDENIVAYSLLLEDRTSIESLLKRLKDGEWGIEGSSLRR